MSETPAPEAMEAGSVQWRGHRDLAWRDPASGKVYRDVGRFVPRLVAVSAAVAKTFEEQS